MRRLTGVVLCVLLTSGLAACGDPIDNYCQEIKDHRKELNEMTEAGTQFGLITHLPMLQELADAAPRDLSDEWAVFLGAVKQLTKAVDATGHPPEDFSDATMPDGLTSQEKAAVTAAADRLASPDTIAASQGIDVQARDVCKVNLGR